MALSDLSRLLTNYYTSLYERSARRFNSPIRISTLVHDQLGITDSGVTLDQNVPDARYYGDATIVGTYDETNGFPAATGTNYLSYSNLVFDSLATQGWIVMRLKPTFGNGASVNSLPTLFELGNVLNNRIYCYYHRAANAWTITRDAGGSAPFAVATATHSANQSITLTFFWTSTQIGGALNDGPLNSTSNTTIPTVSNTEFYLGGSPSTGGLHASECVYLWAVIGNGTITDTDVDAFHALGDSDPGWIDLPSNSFGVLDPSFLWPGVNQTHTPPALYGENVYA